MPSATTLRIEGVTGPACGADPAAWSLGGGARQFQR
jgi:hypothetical protein